MLLGNEAFIDRIVREDGGFAEKILLKIKDIGRAFSRMTDKDARVQYDRVKRAEGLYYAAIERRGWKYSDGMITGGSEEMEEDGVHYSIKYPVFSKDTIDEDMKALAEMDAVTNIAQERLEKTGKAPSDIFAEFFEKWGNNIQSSLFGDIELPSKRKIGNKAWPYRRKDCIHRGYSYRYRKRKGCFS